MSEGITQSDPEKPSSRTGWDDVFLQSRRELWGILAIWLIFAVWVVGVSGWMGYQSGEEGVEIIFGLPAWVFWGVAVPWGMANVVIFWFCCFKMKDQSLEAAESDDDGGVS